MFRNLLPALADRYRLLAPDYPGFGHSSMPARGEFAYTFDNLAGVVDEFTEMLGLSKYTLYVQDYGAPVGYRLASRHSPGVSRKKDRGGRLGEFHTGAPFSRARADADPVRSRHLGIDARRTAL